MDVDGWKVMTYSTMYRTSHDPLVWWTNNILYIQQLKGYLLHFELDKCLKKKGTNCSCYGVQCTPIDKLVHFTPIFFLFNWMTLTKCDHTSSPLPSSTSSVV